MNYIKSLVSSQHSLPGALYIDFPCCFHLFYMVANGVAKDAMFVIFEHGLAENFFLLKVSFCPHTGAVV